ncbi:putative F-box domain-containing protein [Medicago truncatula]|uniref:Putative F-box domain-containing protein n=1 Tax=Medicago truncatula TaxID=3880 RepID=A0A396HJZ5_MEDTR|nr:putative F-box domain-containing protein [Medicago truncatula]RHN51237.1 putative F-box domain-containing protein [Medicago truncatula]
MWNSIDMIRSLLDRPLSHVLYFLPPKTCVTISLLSRRWCCYI